MQVRVVCKFIILHSWSLICFSQILGFSVWLIAFFPRVEVQVLRCWDKGTLCFKFEFCTYYSVICSTLLAIIAHVNLFISLLVYLNSAIGISADCR